MTPPAVIRRSHTCYQDETYEVVSRWTETTLIEYGPNRKRQPSKSYDRYERYAKATTVGEALALGSFPPDLLWDYEHGHLKVIGGFVREEPLDISKVEDESQLTETDRVIHRWYRRELARKLGLDYKDLFVDKASGESTFMRAHRLVSQREATRILEAASRERRRITDQEVELVLHEWAFARNSNRVNVTPDGQNWVWSDTLGLIQDRVGHIHITSPSERYPEVVQVLCQWLQDHRPKEASSFCFTSINVNCNYAAKLHRDGNNFGPSMIKAFGPFTGGELTYWPEDDKSSKLEDLDPKHQVTLDVRTNLALFNGNCGHCVQAFKGERYSVVYFTLGRFQKAAPEDKQKLRELGVAFPPDNADRYCLLRAPRGFGPQAKAAKGAKQDLPAVRCWSVQDLEAMPHQHQQVWTRQPRKEKRRQDLKDDPAAEEDGAEAGSSPEKAASKAKAEEAEAGTTPPAKRRRAAAPGDVDAGGSDEKLPPAKQAKLAKEAEKCRASQEAKLAKEDQKAKRKDEEEDQRGSKQAKKEACKEEITEASRKAKKEVKQGAKKEAKQHVEEDEHSEAGAEEATGATGNRKKTETFREASLWTQDTRVEYVPHGKKPGTKSYARYEAYSGARTIGEALAKGSLPGDLVFDFERGLLKIIGGPFRDAPLDLSRGPGPLRALTSPAAAAAAAGA